MRTLTTSVALLSLAACQGEIGIGNELEAPPVPAARPPEVVTQTDRVTQVTSPEVDIVFVIDNSCSMSDNQQALADNFPRFMQFFQGSGLDYHIGVVSTDTDNQFEAGILQQSDGLRYIDENVPAGEIEDVFDGMARLGSGGSATERGLEAEFTLLELNADDPANEGFYREDAAIHSIVVTDEDDKSSDLIVTLNEFIRWYGGLKSEIELRSYSSISPSGPDPETGNNPNRYRQVTRAMNNGVEFDIESPDWDAVLERLGIQTSGLRKEYFLSQAPVVDTIQLVILRETGGPQPTAIRCERLDVEGKKLEGEAFCGWTYNGQRNSVLFDTFIPDPLDVIEVTYTLLAATQVPIDETPEKGEEEGPKKGDDGK